jgi:hypothetical protein
VALSRQWQPLAKTHQKLPMPITANEVKFGNHKETRMNTDGSPAILKRKIYLPKLGSRRKPHFSWKIRASKCQCRFGCFI